MWFGRHALFACTLFARSLAHPLSAHALPYGRPRIPRIGHAPLSALAQYFLQLLPPLTDGPYLLPEP
jgi:hypothetical protein